MSRITLSATLLVFFALSSIPNAQGASVGPPTGGATQIEWKVVGVGHDRVELTVLAPNGRITTKQFKAGNNLTLNLSELPEVIDGTYSFELRIVPTLPPGLQKQLKQLRENGQEPAAEKMLKDAGITPGESRSGAFSVIGGSIVPTDAVEQQKRTAAAKSASATSATANGRAPLTPVTDDQVIPDDLIVQGSACIGLDCVNNESFGFDTIRLKENNLRIKSDDTSTSAGFPATDWQLTFNDSASGGQAKFSIDDITNSTIPFTVEAAALNNSVYIDSTGRVGFRTATPVLDLHMNTNNTPAIRFEQNSSGGFTAQTWDVAGNEANFFVRDVTFGSRLPFRIRPGAPTSSIDIAANGYVGIGTASPRGPFHIFSNINNDAYASFGPDPNPPVGAAQSGVNVGYSGNTFGRASGYMNVRPDSLAVAPNPSLRFMTANVVAMIIDNEGFVGLGTTANPDAPIHYTNGASQARLTAAGVWQDASSRAAKDDILELNSEEAISALRELTPVKYHYKAVPDDPKVGFIAEDVPALVATPQRDGLSALDIVAVVTKVVQEQQKTIEMLTKRIDELEKSQKQEP